MKSLALFPSLSLSFPLFLKEQSKLSQDNARRSLYTLTQGNGEQVEAIRATRTNQDQVGTHWGRSSQPTREGTGFHNKTGSHVTINGTELTDKTSTPEFRTRHTGCVRSHPLIPCSLFRVYLE